MKRTISLIFSLLMLVSFSVSALAKVEIIEAESSELQIDMDEGRRLWNEYIKQLEPYKDDETIFDTAFSYVARYASETYSENLGRSKEEFENKTQYEKLLWLPWIDSARYCPKMSDPFKWNSWESLLVESIQQSYKRASENGEEIGNVYYDLAKWHFEYFSEAKKIFNFVDEFGMEIKEPEELTSKEVTEEVSEEYVSQNIQLPSKAPTESNVELSEAVSDVSEEGIWDNVVDYIKSNVITWIILFVLCGTVVGIVIYRKKKK